jgi:hypothetical protein
MSARLLQTRAALGPAAQGSDADMVARLIELGWLAQEAELFVALVPIGFSRPVLEHLGITNFPATLSVQNRRGRWIEVPFALQPIYVAALAIAREHRRTGRLIDSEVYQALTLRCAAIDAVNKALSQGRDLKGGTGHFAVIRPRAEDFVSPAPRWGRFKRALWGSRK